MKKIICAIAACLFSTFAMAQAASLRVVNQTACTVYFVIQGDPAPTCGYSTPSSVISLAPGGMLMYPNSASVPGFPASPAYFLNMAYGIDFPPGCSTGGNGYRVGEPCTGNLQARVYPAYTPGCNLCNPNVRITWQPAAAPGGQATLVFQ